MLPEQKPNIKVFSSPQQLEEQKKQVEEELEALKSGLWYPLSDQEKQNHNIRRADLKKMLALEKKAWQEVEAARVKWDLINNQLKWLNQSPKQRRTKRTVAIATISLIGLVIILAIALGDKNPSVKINPDITNSSFDGSVLVCEQYIKQRLNDRSSYESVNWTKVVETQDGLLTTTATFRAKNAFGAYILQTLTFTYTKEGTIISATQL